MKSRRISAVHISDFPAPLSRVGEGLHQIIEKMMTNVRHENQRSSHTTTAGKLHAEKAPSTVVMSPLMASRTCLATHCGGRSAGD